MCDRDLSLSCWVARGNQCKGEVEVELDWSVISETKKVKG